MLILAELREKGNVTVAELMAKFGVSIETIRRDLYTLEEAGRLSRVHGGAVPKKEEPLFPTLAERLGRNREGKLRAAEAAASLLFEGAVVAIDSGSTAQALCEVVKKKFRHLTVFTTAPDVFNVLAAGTDFELYLSGGAYMRKEHVFWGYDTEAAILSHNFDFAFLTPSSVTPSGIGASVFEIIGNERAFMKQAAKTVFVFDSGKTERAPAPFCLSPLSPDFLYATDGGIAKERETALLSAGIKLLKK